MEHKRPFMASGKLVDDYTLLEEYWKAVKNRVGETDIVKRDYLEKAMELITKSPHGLIHVRDLVLELSKIIKEDLDRDAALEAMLRLTGLNPTKTERDALLEKSLDDLSRIIAGYVLEILDSLGKIRIKEK